MASNNLTIRYKFKYANAFTKTISSVFIIFIISIWFYFFWNPLYTKLIVGFLFLLLFFWNIKWDGSLKIIKDEDGKYFFLDKKVNEKIAITAFKIGWNYQFLESINGMPNISFAGGNQVGSGPRQQTHCRVIILYLATGEHVVLNQELLPWIEIGNYDYLGHFIDELEIEKIHYLKTNFQRISKFFN